MKHTVYLNAQGGAMLTLVPGEALICTKVHPGSPRRVGEILCFRNGSWGVRGYDGTLLDNFRTRLSSTWGRTEWERVEDLPEIKLEDLL